MKNTIATFAQLVRYYRQERGITQQQIAQQAGLSASYMTLLETGRRKNPSWRTVLKLAEAFGLNARERRALIRSAGYSEDTVRKTSVDLSPPVMSKLSHFLSLPAGSPKGSKVLRESLDLLESLVAEKSLSRDHRKAVKAARLITGAFFSSPEDIEVDDDGHPKNGKESSEIALADRLRELINVFVDGSIPIKKRISLADELISFVRWKMHGRKD